MTHCHRTTRWPIFDLYTDHAMTLYEVRQVLPCKALPWLCHWNILPWQKCHWTLLAWLTIPKRKICQWINVLAICEQKIDFARNSFVQLLPLQFCAVQVLKASRCFFTVLGHFGTNHPAFGRMHNHVHVLYNLCFWPFRFMFIQLASFLNKPKAKEASFLSDLACAFDCNEELSLFKTIVWFYFQIPKQILYGYSQFY